MARNKKTSKEEQEKIFRVYVDNHNWIDYQGMVDRAAPYVVGGYLHINDKKPLYDLAKFKKPMEQRTAIVSTYYFIRKNEIEVTFKIAQILVNDKDEHIQKTVGSQIREAGKKNVEKLKEFLDKYATEMSRITLGYAIEKLDKEKRENYLNLKLECQLVTINMRNAERFGKFEN